jgi:ketosteroid isomerase-like protein
MMSKKRDIHVVPHKDGWATRKEGAGRAGSVHPTQKEAAGRAREQALRERVEVVIHRRDGRIRDSDSYGNDPHPPEDRKH